MFEKILVKVPTLVKIPWRREFVGEAVVEVGTG